MIPAREDYAAPARPIHRLPGHPLGNLMTALDKSTLFQFLRPLVVQIPYSADSVGPMLARRSLRRLCPESDRSTLDPQALRSSHRDHRTPPKTVLSPFHTTFHERITPYRIFVLPHRVRHSLARQRASRPRCRQSPRDLLATMFLVLRMTFLIFQRMQQYRAHRPISVRQVREQSWEGGGRRGVFGRRRTSSALAPATQTSAVPLS